jgi:cytochrome b involved in lipid metabolism
MKVSLFFAGAAALLGVSFFGCDEAKEEATPKTVSLTSLNTHNTATSCWVAVDGDVYDVTGFLGKHPVGAEKITPYCGQDITAVFNSVHNSAKAFEDLNELPKKGKLPVKVASISAKTLATKTAETECWITFGGQVYDVTNFLATHPGGSKVLLAHCGRDGSAGLGVHTAAAKAMLADTAKFTSKGTLTGDAVTSKTYTAAEVATHNSNGNCWMTIGTKIYDVSDYFKIEQSDDNIPYRHRGGYKHKNYNNNIGYDSQYTATRQAIVASLCGKDVSLFFYDVTYTAGTTPVIAPYEFTVPKNELCLTTLAYNSKLIDPSNSDYKLNQANTMSFYIKAGTCAGTSPTCQTEGGCTIWSPGGYKPHVSETYRQFFERYYIGDIQG